MIVRRDADRNWHKAVPPCVLLSVMVKVSSVRFSLPFRSRGAIIVPSGSCVLGEEERRGRDDTRYSFLRCKKKLENRHFGVSRIRTGTRSTIAKCFARFDRENREKEFLLFERRRRRFVGAIWQKLIQFIVIVRIIYNSYIR